MLNTEVIQHINLTEEELELLAELEEKVASGSHGGDKSICFCFN